MDNAMAFPSPFSSSLSLLIFRYFSFFLLSLHLHDIIIFLVLTGSRLVLKSVLHMDLDNLNIIKRMGLVYPNISRLLST